MSVWSVNRINYLLNKFDNSNYLEVGIKRGATLKEVQSSTKVGVDPQPHILAKDLQSAQCNILVMDSDSFFNSYSGEKFDVIYLDGLHTFEQTYRDFCNSEKHLSETGFVLIDDVWPLEENGAFPTRTKRNDSPQESKYKNHWWGDVYKIPFAIDNLHLDWEFVYLMGGNTQLLCWKSRILKTNPVIPMSKDEVGNLSFMSWKILREQFPKVGNLNELSELL